MYSLYVCTVCACVQSVRVYSLRMCTVCICVQSVRVYSLYVCTVCACVQSVRVYSLYRMHIQYNNERMYFRNHIIFSSYGG